MNTFSEVKDTITLTTASVSVGQGSFIQLRLRSKRQTPIQLTYNGDEYQIQSGSVTPILDGTVIVYKDSTETEIFIERSTFNVVSKIDENEVYVVAKINALSGGIAISADGASAGGNAAPSAFTSRVLSDADNGMSLKCASAQVATVNIGRAVGFGCAFKGAVSFAGSATVTDVRTTGATNPWCALMNTDVDTYDVVGSKA